MCMFWAVGSRGGQEPTEMDFQGGLAGAWADRCASGRRLGAAIEKCNGRRVVLGAVSVA